MQARVSCPGKLIEQQEEEDEKNTKRHNFFFSLKIIMPDTFFFENEIFRMTFHAYDLHLYLNYIFKQDMRIVYQLQPFARP